jgi:hypothetical protein
MRSRGYDGSMPLLGSGAAPAGQWMASMAVPAVAVVVAIASWTVMR